MASEWTVTSSTRVDLAGGTLDCWPLYLFLNDPVTVNVSIDIFTHAHLALLPAGDSRIFLSSGSAGGSPPYERAYLSLAEALGDTDSRLDLLRVVLGYFRKEIGARGFRLETGSDSPIGGGLGGSSSLCISIVKAFSKWLGVSQTESDLVRLASHLEARVLLKPTGTQDYFPAIQSGLCVITYGAEGPRCVRHPVDPRFFQDRFTLVYTGRSHHSGINNWQVIKDWLDGDSRTRRAMDDLSAISREVARVMVSSLADDEKSRSLSALFEREFEARVRLSSGFSSPEIEALQGLAKGHGAVVKICGAGGGGSVFIWSPRGVSSERTKMIEEISSKGFTVLDAKPYFGGGNP